MWAVPRSTQAGPRASHQGVAGVPVDGHARDQAALEAVSLGHVVRMDAVFAGGGRVAGDDPIGHALRLGRSTELPSPSRSRPVHHTTRAKTAGMTATLSSSEHRRADLLVVAKRRATGLLVVAAAVFVVAAVLESRAHWLAWVEAAAIASLVGGLADWFAVTALFRRPLGLPIPHTAIVVERKDRFAETLGAFVQENFLSPAAVTERLEASHAVERVAGLAGGARTCRRPGGPRRRRPGGRDGSAPRRGRAPGDRRAASRPHRQGGPGPAGGPGAPAADQGGPARAAGRRRPSPR